MEYSKAGHERRQSQIGFLSLAVSISQFEANVLQLLIYLLLLSFLLPSSLLLLFPVVPLILYSLLRSSGKSSSSILVITGLMI